MTKLCIIIPNYNKAQWIGELLDSLLPQITDEVQIILIDDASTDNSVEIIRNHPIFDKITFIQNESNRWCSATRNTGLEYVRSNVLEKPWYCFIDSDDFVKPNYIQTLLGYIEDNQFDCYVFKHDLYDETNKEYVPICITTTDSPKEGDITGDDQLAIYTRLFNWNCFEEFNMSNDFRQRHCGEDLEYTVRVAKEKKIKYTDDIIYTYRLDVPKGQARLSGGLDKE